VVLRINTDDDVRRKVAAVCRHRIVRTAVNRERSASWRLIVRLEPFGLEVVAIFWRRVLLIKR
jgi:hypothetical protein